MKCYCIMRLFTYIFELMIGLINLWVDLLGVIGHSNVARDFAAYSVAKQ